LPEANLREPIRRPAGDHGHQEEVNRMRKSDLLVYGICVALAAGTVAYFIQSRGRPSDDAARAPRKLLVASRDVAAGTSLSEGDLTLTDSAGNDVRGSFSVPAAAIGRIATSPLRKGQMLTETDLAPRGSGAAIMHQLPAGYRAITVTLRDAGPAVALFPGANVDVIATVEGPARGSMRGETMARTVVERSRVMAVNNEAIGVPPSADKDERAAAKKLSVTLAVTPAQAAQIELAASRGTIGLALCSTSDPAAPVSEAVTMSSLLGLPNEPAPRAAPEKVAEKPAAKPAEKVAEKVAEKPAAKPETPKPAVWEVTVIRGDKAERVGFEEKKPASK
jgi:pilus assembly protein CpaB